MAAGGVGHAAQRTGPAQADQAAAAARAGPTPWQRRAGEQQQLISRPAWPPPQQPQRHGQQVQQRQQQQHHEAQPATPSSRPLVPVAAPAAPQPFPLLQRAPPPASLAAQQSRPPFTPSQQLQRDRPPAASSVSAAPASAAVSASVAAPSELLALVRRAPQQTALAVQDPQPQPPGASSTVALPVLLVHTSLVEACTQTDGGRGRGRGANGSDSRGSSSGSGLSGGGLASLFELLPMHFQLRESASIAADIVRPAFPSFKLFIQREEELDLAFRRTAAVKRSLSGLSDNASLPLAEKQLLHQWLTFRVMRVDDLFPQNESSG